MSQTLSDDLLRGAREISLFIFGTADERRKVYHLAEAGVLPTFKMGRIICARRSSILTRMEKMEQP
jgi:hypothetical protein